VTFTEEELPKCSGDFILGYYSNNMSTIVGVTEPFQIQLPTVHHDSSSSDSSDFSSEDDSTVVMKMRSRSQSPHKSKHHDCSSGSPAEPKIRELSVTDCAAAGSESVRCPAEGSSSQTSGPGATEKNAEDSGM
ncbi:hypothetical protein XENOCAPTIV_021181, partial [Xenoophorus captivus]